MIPARLFIYLLALLIAPSAEAASLRIAYSSISAAMLPLFVVNDKRLFENTCKKAFK